MARMKIHAGRLCWNVQRRITFGHWSLSLSWRRLCLLLFFKVLYNTCWPGIPCACRPGPRQYHCHCGCGGRYCSSFSCFLMLCCRLLRSFSSTPGFLFDSRGSLHQLELPKVCIEEGCFLIQTLGMLPFRIGLHEVPRIYAGP